VLGIVHDAIDDGPYSFAREAWVEWKNGAYHETFEVHDHVVLQAHEVLDCPSSVNAQVTLVSSTVEAEFGVIFVASVHSLISPRGFPRANLQVADEALVVKFFRNLDCFDGRHVAIHLHRQMH